MIERNIVLITTLIKNTQGIVEGPDEFADGVAYGVRSLMGHVVGGAADTISLISSALGNAVASLVLDPEYRRVS